MGKYLQQMNESQVQINYDEEIDRVIVKYVSPTNGEVINQIPSKDFVDFEKEFVKTIGLLFDKSV
ncbi:hypothetical protein EL26_06325 [Tumebacillus flagellatus]|uniref:Flagellar protein FlaG n=2 Tax=Tumebacillus flagellatus TaxID=1157490 RepID=A0A074LPL6_9BACL|nr:hypothetical protein EL26_06325 [Tumebacillus flagellatus]